MDRQEIQIRYTEAKDEVFLCEWLNNENVNRYLTVQTREEVAEMSRIWNSFYKARSSLTAVVDGEPSGMATLFLMPYKKVVHMAMGYLVVDPKKQDQGIGRDLLKNLIHLAKTYFRLELLHFEVYGDSPVIPMLESFGFKELFKQGEYIKLPSGEYLPRRVLEKDLINSESKQ